MPNKRLTIALTLSWLCAAALSLPLSGHPAFAAAPNSQKPVGEAFEDDSGNLFMEEVVDNKPKPKLPKIPIDLSRVGVSVDPHGNIVPIKDSATDPWFGTGVKPFMNEIDSSFQALPQPFVYGGNYGYTPYGYRPYVPGYNAPGYLNPNLNPRPIYPNGFVGNGFYPGYGGYGGYGNYGGFGGYGWRRPLATLNIGNFQASIGSVPAYAPPPFYNPAFSAPAFSSPGFYGGGFLAPNTTTTQTSMWKAFNLAF